MTNEQFGTDQYRNSSPAFFLTVGFLLYVPLIWIFPNINSFMLPWRGELVTGVVLPIFAIIALTHAKDTNLSVFGIRACLAIYGLVVLSLVSGLWAISVRSSVHHAGVWASYLATFVLTAIFWRARSGRRAALWMVATVTLALAAPAAIEFLVQGFVGQPATLTGRYSRYAELLNVFLPLLAISFLTGSGWLRMVSFIAFCLSFLLPFLIARRAPIIVVIAEAMLFAAIIFLSPRLRKYGKRYLILAGTAICLMLVVQLISFNFVSGNPLERRTESPLTRSSDQLRSILQRTALEMFVTNPILGVGADNFGLEYQNYRPAIAAIAPDDPEMSIAQDLLAERAHNEFLQIAAELGIVGIAVFLGLLIVLMIGLYKRWQSAYEPLFVAAAGIAIAGFLASSFVTSFSFRILPNGIAFFLIAGIGLAVPQGTSGSDSDSLVRRKVMNACLAPSILALVSMAVLAGIAAWAAEQPLRAFSNPADTQAIEARLAFAERLDPENAAILFGHGRWLFSAARYSEAAAKFEESIARGRIAVTGYSYAASSYNIDRQPQKAYDVISRGLLQYPSSVFLLVRRSVVAEELGLVDQAISDSARAASIDDKQARSWRNLITQGARVASQKSFDEHLPALMDLDPQTGVYAVKDEREVLHPEEKVTLPGFDSPFGGN